MAALAKDRNTPRRVGNQFSRAVAAAVKFFAGSIVMRNAAGFATPGATALNLKADGVATEQVDNTGGANGDVSVPVERGCWRFANSAGADEITAADIGNVCYVVDDQTVAKTDGVGTRSAGPVIDDVDADGVWVSF